MTALRRLLPALVAGIFLFVLPGCKDPKREAELQSREEQVKAREKALVDRSAGLDKREADLATAKKAVEDHEQRLKAREGELTKLEGEIALRHQEIDRIEAEMKAAKVVFETKVKRGPAPSVSSERIIVIDPEKDEVLYERNPDRKGAIASTTKIMSAILLIESGNLDGEMTVEQPDTVCAPVKMGLKAGEKYTRRDLLTALMVKSSNDIAQALARDNAGSLEAFVAKMNAKAKELGCTDTLFINPNGLPPVGDQPEPYSTARDLARIARYADKLPDLRAMVKLKTYVFKHASTGKSETLDNTNRVLRTCEYCDGFKTGYTNAAGHCLVASGSRDGRRRIVVVLNGTTTSVWKDAETLLEWALKA